MNGTQREQRLKHSLVNATETVRNKFQQLRKDHLEVRKNLEDQYKPITKKLSGLIALNQHNVAANSLPRVKAKEEIAIKTEGVKRELNEKSDEGDDDDFEQSGDLDDMRERRRNELLGKKKRKDSSFSRTQKSKHTARDVADNIEEEIEKKSGVLHVDGNDLNFDGNDSNDDDDEYMELFRPLKFQLSSKSESPSRKIRINDVKKQIEIEKNVSKTKKLQPSIQRRIKKSIFTPFKYRDKKNLHQLLEKKKPYAPINPVPTRKSISKKKKSSTKSIIHGDGLQHMSMKEYNSENPCKNMFSYWNDPNELVDRLRLLISSSSAGHTGHNNEIISIVEELREANIIE